MDHRVARITSSARRSVLVFLLRCAAYWAVALAAVSRFPRVEAAGIELTLRTLQGVLWLARIPVVRSGDALYVAHVSVDIVSDCSPHMAYLIYAAVVLAFPAAWRARIFGLLAGAIVIHVFNTLRILALIAILALKREWFDFAHVYLWQTGTVVVVFATFAMWLRYAAPRSRPA